MTPRKRLTRQESKELTRLRLTEAAERLFIRKGFDHASVEEISEAAGFSRGAFYSNFKDKDQVLVAVIERLRPQIRRALDDTLQQISEPADRAAAVRDWFSNQWRLKDFNALWMEFSRRAMRHRSIRKCLAELRRQELETYVASLSSYVCASSDVPREQAVVAALVLLAVSHGLGSISIDTEAEWEHMYAEAARFAFDRMSAPQTSQLG